MPILIGAFIKWILNLPAAQIADCHGVLRYVIVSASIHGCDETGNSSSGFQSAIKKKREAKNLN